MNYYRHIFYNIVKHIHYNRDVQPRILFYSLELPQERSELLRKAVIDQVLFSEKAQRITGLSNIAQIIRAELGKFLASGRPRYAQAPLRALGCVGRMHRLRSSKGFRN